MAKTKKIETKTGAKPLGKRLLKEFMMQMMVSRKFEEQVQLLFSRGLVHGTTHLGIGEEATAAGTVLACEEHDYMLTTHRGHAQALARGVDVNAMMAEILAKDTGICRGKGGSMHIADIDKGILGSNGVLGSSPPIACGAGLTIRRRGEDRIVVCFFGDGSSNLGGVHEAMNLASVWNLPVLFVIVNNGYGMSTPLAKATKDPDLTKRAYPFAMPAEEVDGNNVIDVYHAVKKARKYVVKHGPMLIVQHTYRISGHSKSDGNLYRSKEEIAAWQAECPILRFKRYMLDNGIYDEAAIAAMDKEATAIIEAAVQFGKDSPEPPLDAILTDIYA